MAVKHIIAKGIGFTPGSVKFIPTHGFIGGAGAPPGGLGAALGFWFWFARGVRRR